MNLQKCPAMLLAVLAGLVAGGGCVTPPGGDEDYVDPNTRLVAPYRPKGDGAGVTGWDERAREIERSLGS
jgi:hypothetical protein